MRSPHLVRSGVLGIGLVLAIGSARVEAQTRDQPAGPSEARIPGSIGDEDMAWMLNNLRPSGQPVVPMFEGWYPNDDGSRAFCFGYYSLNTKEAVEIPLGPNNFIEPAEFDGRQPTHFDVVPPEFRRHFCVFTVTVPQSFGDKDVVWTLKVGGRDYSVPGHATSVHYQLEEPDLYSRTAAAPVVGFVEPAGPEVRGRSYDRAAAEASVRSGAPLTLKLSLANATGHPLGRARVLWAKHQGPGVVTFGQWNSDIRSDASRTESTTTATFSSPGEYLLRVQAVDWNRGNPFGYECCWTNAFLRVSVTP